MSFCFYFIKCIYVSLTIAVFILHCFYIYLYYQRFDFETIFHNNQFTHFMGIFLGSLFRFSGMLSAMKEKISLTFTYTLFLLLIMILEIKLDNIFFLHLFTFLFSIIYLVELKSLRAKQNRANNSVRRAIMTPRSANGVSQPSAPSATGATASQVAISLLHDRQAAGDNSTPTAPPYEPQSDRPNSGIYFNPLHNSPPPSYSELYETK